MVSTTKHPGRVAAGKATARKRWGEYPRIVRLDELGERERRVVLALIEAAKPAPES